MTPGIAASPHGRTSPPSLQRSSAGDALPTWQRPPHLAAFALADDLLFESFNVPFIIIVFISLVLNIKIINVKYI
jgi:hypothetical protein